MVTAKKIKIEIAYATADKQSILMVELEEGATIEMAIDRSGIVMLFPEIHLSEQSVGIFSQKKKLSDTVKAGDRIEIYRSLMIDPKEARKKRVGDRQRKVP